MSRRDAGAGFTLVELLIALTLVGLLATLVFGGVRLAARAWGRTDDRAAEAADRWAVANVLRDAIAGAYPAFASSDPRDRTIAFDGEAGSLTLLAPLPQAIAAGVTVAHGRSPAGPSRTVSSRTCRASLPLSQPTSTTTRWPASPPSGLP